jgi:hypothetical protein
MAPSGSKHYTIKSIGAKGNYKKRNTNYLIPNKKKFKEFAEEN